MAVNASYIQLQTRRAAWLAFAQSATPRAAIANLLSADIGADPYLRIVRRTAGLDTPVLRVKMQSSLLPESDGDLVIPSAYSAIETAVSADLDDGTYLLQICRGRDFPVIEGSISRTGATAFAINGLLSSATTIGNLAFGASGTSGSWSGGGSASSGAIVPRTGDLSMVGAAYRRVRGGARTYLDRLMPLQIQGTNKAYLRFVAQSSGMVQSLRLYLPTAGGNLGNGGVITAWIYEQDSSGQPTGTPFGLGVRDQAERGMVGGSYTTAYQNRPFETFPINGTRALVGGNRYVIEISNTAADPVANCSRIMAAATLMENGRPLPWADPKDWGVTWEQGGLADLTEDGHNGLYWAPIMELEVGGQKWGNYPIEAGSGPSTWRESGGPIEQYFPADGTRRISGVTVSASKTEFAGGFDVVVWDYASNSAAATVSVADPGVNSDQVDIEGVICAVLQDYDVPLPEPVSLSGAFGIRFVPHGASVWRTTPHRTGAYYGASYPAAQTECYARYLSGSTWNNLDFWNRGSNNWRTDQVWRIGYYEAGTEDGSVLSGFGELPSDYPITSMTLSGDVNLPAGGSVMLRLLDQNSLPAYPVTVTTPAGITASAVDSEGRVMLMAGPSAATGSITFAHDIASVSLAVPFTVASAVPGTPLVAVALGSGQISVQVTDTATNETGFSIEISTPAGGVVHTEALPANPVTGPLAPYVHPVTPGGVYYVRARALPNSPWTATQTVSVPNVVMESDPVVSVRASTDLVDKAGALTLTAEVQHATRIQWYRGGLPFGAETTNLVAVVPFSSFRENGRYEFFARAFGETKQADSAVVVVNVEIPETTALGVPGVTVVVTIGGFE